MEKIDVYLGLPLYNRSMDCGAALADKLASRSLRVYSRAINTSLIPTNCNALWCDALNHREDWGLRYFAMLHGDIEADRGWVDVLVGEADKFDADIVSAVVPQKNNLGLTSTALSLPGNRLSYFTRLTQRQVRHAEFPDTFGISEASQALTTIPGDIRIDDAPAEYLLANTGCMICRLDRDWCSKVWFAGQDGIEQRNGQWQHTVFPEDWHFTRAVAELGGKVMATKLVRVKHWGLTDFDSHEVWGKPRDV
jgi:hypothetical protein